MKQFRVVYQYRRDLVRGAGAAFVIAKDETEARILIGQAMPGVEPIEVKEEFESPLAAYERHPRLRLAPPVVEKQPGRIDCGVCCGRRMVMNTLRSIANGGPNETPCPACGPEVQS